MKPLSLLTAVCLLASPAAAMSPACDQIDNPGQRSACHAQDDAQWRWRQRETQRPQPHPPALARRPTIPPSLDSDPLYLAVRKVRRENCWDWAGEQAAASGAGPNEKEGRRTDLTQACLAKTLGIAERVATTITTEALADQFKVCMNRLKTEFAADPPIPLDIFIMDACVQPRG